MRPRRRRTYRTPIVMTLAAMGPGCVPGLSHDAGDAGTGGGDNYEDGNLDDDGVGGASTTSGGASTGGMNPLSGGTSSGGATEYPECPEGSGYGFTVPCTPYERCQIEMDCTSGAERRFVFDCAASGESWELEDTFCANPAEFCDRGTWDEAATCQGGLWMYQGQGGNPPGPCPDALPEEDSECSGGAAFGGDRTACGYPCADGYGWTVTGCVTELSGDPADPYGPASWQSDDACNNGGQGGAGP